MAGEMLILHTDVLDGADAAVARSATGANHTDQEPSNISVVTGGGGMLHGIFSAQPDNYANVNCVGIVNHNLDRLRGSYWRAVVEGGIRGTFIAISNIGVNLYPTSLDSSTTLTGTYTDVDDDPWLAASEADYLQPSVGGSYMARFGFATPTSLSNVTTGGFDSLFAIRVMPTSTGRLTVKLYENNVAIRTLLDNEYVGSNPTLSADPKLRNILLLGWNTSELGTADGSLVQVQIEATNCNVASVLWMASYARTVYGIDSGFIPVDPTDVADLNPPDQGGVEPMKNDFYLFATGTALTGADGVVPNVMVQLVTAANDDSLPTLGVLVAGTAFRPSVNFASASLGVIDESQGSRTLGGQMAAVSLSRRRSFTYALGLCTPDEHDELFSAIDWRKGLTGAFLVSGFPEHDTLRRAWTAYVVQADGGEPWTPFTANLSGSAEVTMFRRVYALEEKL